MIIEYSGIHITEIFLQTFVVVQDFLALSIQRLTICPCQHVWKIHAISCIVDILCNVLSCFPQKHPTQYSTSDMIYILFYLVFQGTSHSICYK